MWWGYQIAREGFDVCESGLWLQVSSNKITFLSGPGGAVLLHCHFEETGSIAFSFIKGR
jgi:hypothetical protein